MIVAQETANATAQPPLDVSIVVPVYRNADTLRELYQRLSQVLAAESLTFEILFVDDRSPDGSRRVVAELAEADPRVAGVAMTSNVGQHRAILAGLAHARGDWAVIMDADLQDPPEAIPALLARGEAGYAAVFAGRRGRYESRSRLLTSRLFKLLLHQLCGIPTDAGIFVALHRSLVARLLTMGGSRPFVISMIGCAGAPLASLPVPRATRPSGVSSYNTWRRLKSGWRGVAYVLDWKWRAFCHLPARRPETVPVDAFIGSRFTGDEGAARGAAF